MRVILDGKRWNLVYAKLPRGVDGECDSPETPNKRIKISRAVLRNDQRHLETLIHEMGHACLWAVDEEFMHAFARDAARVLTRLGFGMIND